MRFMYDYSAKKSFFEYLKQHEFTGTTFQVLFSTFPRNRFWKRLWIYGARHWEVKP